VSSTACNYRNDEPKSHPSDHPNRMIGRKPAPIFRRGWSQGWSRSVLHTRLYSGSVAWLIDDPAIAFYPQLISRSTTSGPSDRANQPLRRVVSPGYQQLPPSDCFSDQRGRKRQKACSPPMRGPATGCGARLCLTRRHLISLFVSASTLRPVDAPSLRPRCLRNQGPHPARSREKTTRT
jgi:hypothetical protein